MNKYLCINCETAQPCEIHPDGYEGFFCPDFFNADKEHYDWRELHLKGLQKTADNLSSKQTIRDEKDG